MVTQALVASDLTIVEWPVHHPPTLRHLTPLLRLILKMMKTMKRVEKKVKMMSRDFFKTSMASFLFLMTKEEKR
jgi:hypothetical protein